jgi:hypothetical protein
MALPRLRDANPDLRLGRARVIARHSWDSVARVHEALYTEIEREAGAC